MSDVAFSDIPGFKPYMENTTTKFRALLLETGYVWECAICKLTEWNGVSAPLQIDHVNGDRKDCTRKNIRFLCPNCHALTDTFVGRNRHLKGYAAKYTTEAVSEAYKIALLDASTENLPTANKVIGVLTSGKTSRSSWVRERVVSVCESQGLALSTTRSVSKSKRHGRSQFSWPSDSKLESLLRKNSRLQVSKMLGVSDNAIKKRCAARGIAEPETRRFVLSEKQVSARSRLREDARRAKKLERLKSLHGTVAGYSLERRLGLDTCASCRKANADYALQLRNR